ncbi:ferrous iron transport protein B [Flexistipes sinusarabici]|uniref:ferrous iron transport protein B n=1 Tax=Flexistipes sinusarabici TaxID=2352 RepID=UPI0023556E64|nr:ferrous iron transport protein B [Flexistipes sinusarabici]
MTHKNKYKTLLVGNPNVGKSALFYQLTGKYASVSNYPGTTVSITSGKMSIGEHHEVEIIDTPGFYNMMTITEEEKVTKQIILDENPDAVVHVVDAKNIERMLPLTLQLIEAGLPVILVLNMFDELKNRGMDIQISHLEHDLGIPVVETVAIKGQGVSNLISRITSVAEGRHAYEKLNVNYGKSLEEKISDVQSLIKGDYSISKRSIALLVLQNDRDILTYIKNEPQFNEISKIAEEDSAAEASLSVSHVLHNLASSIIKEHIKKSTKRQKSSFQGFVDKVTFHPIFSLFIVAIILYYGFYKFVGQFGAGFLVDLIEVNIFENYINPSVNNFFRSILGDTVFFNLFAGEYGIITLGLRYAIAIVLPVVSTFFLLFSVIEDSGYLVRLSMSLDKMFKKIGLSGRSVIPLILGLGCGTMATIVTRTLETKRERLVVTFLLALTIPCSAQLGVILGILGVSFTALAIWFFTILIIFTLAGFVLNRYTKGEPATFFMEIPPIRWPKIGNVLAKTFNRLKWYALEVIPIFVYASILIWVGKITKIFELLTGLLAYPANWAGLPDKMGEIFLYGFFRRDFGAAGMYDLTDVMTLRELVVATVILTLFVPCIAQFSVMIKERGTKTAVLIFLAVIPFAFLVGIILNQILLFWGMA